MSEHYGKRRINVRAIIYRDGKLLAVKHRRGDKVAHYYAVPGGGLDPQESLADCLVRELREETGVTAQPGRLLFIQQFPSSRLGYAEELEFFFAVDNPDDFAAINLENTSVLILVDVHVIDHGVDVLVEKRVDCQRGSLDLRAGKGLQRVL